MTSYRVVIRSKENPTGNDPQSPLLFIDHDRDYRIATLVNIALVCREDVRVEVYEVRGAES